jgi:hypothetical protein
VSSSVSRPKRLTGCVRSAQTLDIMKRPLAYYHPALGTGFFCMDCGCDTNANEQYYMIRDGLWKSVNPRIDGMLCLMCLERRLGRSLRAFDFAQVPVNTLQAAHCPELAARLERKASPKRTRHSVRKLRRG